MTTTGLSNSDRLRLTIKLAEPRLDDLSHQFWNHPNLVEIFPKYLLTLYASMRATVPLAEAATARARELADSDPLAEQLVPYLVKHAKEELHHDEWLLDDMEVIGLDRKEVLARIPPAPIAELMGAQYYWTYFAHPVAVLGSFAVLEGSPPLEETLDKLVERGIPKDALRCIYKHAILDPHHRDDLNDVLDVLPLEPRHAAILGVSSLHVVSKLSDVIEGLLQTNGAGS